MGMCRGCARPGDRISSSSSSSPPAWSAQYIQVLRPNWALPVWRTASPASNSVAKLTLLYIPLGHCCLSTVSALMAGLTSVGTKKRGGWDGNKPSIGGCIAFVGRDELLLSVPCAGGTTTHKGRHKQRGRVVGAWGIDLLGARSALGVVRVLVVRGSLQIGVRGAREARAS